MVAWVTAVAWVRPLGPVLLPASEAAKIKKKQRRMYFMEKLEIE